MVTMAADAPVQPSGGGFEDLLTERFNAILHGLRNSLTTELAVIQNEYRKRIDPSFQLSGSDTRQRSSALSNMRVSAVSAQSLGSHKGAKHGPLHALSHAVPHSTAVSRRNSSDRRSGQMAMPSLVAKPGKITVEAQLSQALVSLPGQVTIASTHAIEDAAIGQIRHKHFNCFAQNPWEVMHQQLPTMPVYVEAPLHAPHHNKSHCKSSKHKKGHVSQPASRRVSRDHAEPAKDGSPPSPPSDNSPTAFRTSELNHLHAKLLDPSVIKPETNVTSIKSSFSSTSDNASGNEVVPVSHSIFSTGSSHVILDSNSKVLATEQDSSVEIVQPEAQRGSQRSASEEPPFLPAQPRHTLPVLTAMECAPDVPIGDPAPLPAVSNSATNTSPNPKMSSGSVSSQATVVKTQRSFNSSDDEVNSVLDLDATEPSSNMKASPSKDKDWGKSLSVKSCLRAPTNEPLEGDAVPEARTPRISCMPEEDVEEVEITEVPKKVNSWRPDTEKRPSKKSVVSTTSRGAADRPSLSWNLKKMKRNRSGSDAHNGEDDDYEHSSEEESGSEEEDYSFELLPVWQAKERHTVRLTLNMNAEFTTSHSFAGDSMIGGDKPPEVDEKHCADKFILKPTGFGRIGWDLLGFVLIAYDCIVLPLQFFDFDETQSFKIMTWIVRIYWSADWPLSFITGYDLPERLHMLSESPIEMRFSKIAGRYIRTWMVFDALVCTFDWLELAFDGLEGLAAARVGKFVKAVRLLRMIRLMRVLRANRNSTMPDFLKQLTYQLSGEKTHIVFSILRIIVAMVVIVHFMACVWYGIGSAWSERLPDNWTKHYNVHYDDVGFEYSYTTSFHWSLTQFAGNIEVGPVNALERTYAIVALLFGFISAAFIVSSITSAMTRLQIVMARQSTQVAMLNRYLWDNNISSKLALRVQKNASHAAEQSEKNTPESSIELLGMVSEPLRLELHYEIHGPVLTCHPFFKRYAEANPASMRRLCHTAVSRLTLFPGDVLFSTGEMPHFPRMYFCCSGWLEYSHEAASRTEQMHEQSWSCEATLWTTWAHHGSLRASSKCQKEIVLATLNAPVFQEIASNFATQYNWPRRYGTWFVEHLNDQMTYFLTDLKDSDVDYELIADLVFDGQLGAPGRQSTGLMETGTGTTGIYRKSMDCSLDAQIAAEEAALARGKDTNRRSAEYPSEGQYTISKQGSHNKRTTVSGVVNHFFYRSLSNLSSLLNTGVRTSTAKQSVVPATRQSSLRQTRSKTRSFADDEHIPEGRSESSHGIKTEDDLQEFQPVLPEAIVKDSDDPSESSKVVLPGAPVKDSADSELLVESLPHEHDQ